MTNLTALWAAHTASLTGAEWWEVVVVNVALAIHWLNGVKTLPLVEHAKRTNGENLSLTALEKTRTVNKWQVIRLDHDWTNLVSHTAVNALAGLNNHDAHSVLLKTLELNGNSAAPKLLLLLGELSLNLVHQVSNLLHTGLLVSVLKSSTHLVIVSKDAVMDLSDWLVKDVLALDDRAVNLFPLSNKLLLLLAEGCNCLLAKCHSGEHILFGNLICTSLKHGNKGGRTAKLKVKVRVIALFIGWVNQELAGISVATNTDARKWSLKRNATNGQSSRSAHDRDGINSVYLISNKGSCNNLNLITEAIWEGWAQRTVNHTSSKGCLLGWTSLTLEVSTRNATNCVHFLNKINSQWEEVVILTLLGNHCSEKYGGIAALNDTGTCCLLCELTSLKGVVLTVEVKFVSYFSHFFPLLSPFAPLQTGLKHKGRQTAP